MRKFMYRSVGQCSLMMLTCVRVTFAFLFQVSCSYFYCKYILHHKYTHIQLYPLGPYFQFLNVFYSVWIIGQRATLGLGGATKMSLTHQDPLHDREVHVSKGYPSSFRSLPELVPFLLSLHRARYKSILEKNSEL